MERLEARGLCARLNFFSRAMGCLALARSLVAGRPFLLSLTARSQRESLRIAFPFLLLLLFLSFLFSLPPRSASSCSPDFRARERGKKRQGGKKRERKKKRMVSLGKCKGSGKKGSVENRDTSASPRIPRGRRWGPSLPRDGVLSPRGRPQMREKGSLCLQRR